MDIFDWSFFDRNASNCGFHFQMKIVESILFLVRDKE